MCDERTELTIWTAGVFDGEGSALIEKVGPRGSKGYSIVVAVANSDPRITDPIKEVWGGHYRTNRDFGKYYPGCNVKLDCSIYFTRDEAKRFLASILPYLKAKGPEAEIVLRALLVVPGEAAIRALGRKRASWGFSVRLRPFYLELQTLRSRRIPTIP